MLSIVTFPDLTLNKRCDDVIAYGDGLKRIIADMFELMYSSSGVGLAAPQVGVLKRIIVIDASEGSEIHRIAMVNPSIKSKSIEREVAEESCLSIPGVTLWVARHVWCDVEYDDVDGNRQSLVCTGKISKIVQHEIDHLNGEIIIDKVGPLARKIAMKSLARRIA
jgi:peptide deformylase